MRRPLLAFTALLAVTVTTTGCALVVTPPGPAPLRYRDAVFAHVTTTSDITYGDAVDQQGNDVTLKLDAYTPTGDTATHRPAIVWVHGGGFKSGDKTSDKIVDQAIAFAKEGYVNFSIDYRLYTPGCTFPAMTSAPCAREVADVTHDAQAAVRWVRANATTYGVDPTRIAIGGSSVGAITALNVGFDSEAPDSTGSNQGYSSAVGAVMSLSGCRLLGKVDAHAAPSVLFHGTADPRVPYQCAVDTQQQATAAGLQSYLVSWDGEGHVPYFQHRPEILAMETNFLYWELDLTHAP